MTAAACLVLVWSRTATANPAPLTIDDFDDGDLTSTLGTPWIPIQEGGGSWQDWELQPRPATGKRGRALDARMRLPPVAPDSQGTDPVVGVLLPVSAKVLAAGPDLDALSFVAAGTPGAMWILYAFDIEHRPTHGAFVPVTDAPRRVVVRFTDLVRAPDDPSDAPFDRSRAGAFAWVAVAPLGHDGCFTLDDVELVAAAAPHETAARESRPYPGRPPRRANRQASSVTSSAWPGRTEIAESVIVPILPDEDALIVEAMVQGTGPHRFVLDTAAAAIVLPAALSASLDIPDGRDQTLVTPSGRPETIRSGRLDEVRIGAARFLDVPVIYVDGPLLDDWGDRGVLGTMPITLFHDLLVTIDAPASTLRLERGRLGHGPHVLRCRIPHAGLGNVLARARVGRERGWFKLDTGNEAPLMLPAGLASRVLPPERAITRVPTADALGVHELEVARVPASVRLGSVSIDQPWALVGGQGLVGLPILRQCVTTWDLARRRVRIESSGNVPLRVEDPRPTVGLFAPWACGVRTVRGVVPGSAADQAGVRAGDVIVAVDGVRAGAARARRAPEAPVRYELLRDNERLDVVLTPRPVLE